MKSIHGFIMGLAVCGLFLVEPVLVQASEVQFASKRFKPWVIPEYPYGAQYYNPTVPGGISNTPMWPNPYLSQPQVAPQPSYPAISQSGYPMYPQPTYPQPTYPQPNSFPPVYPQQGFLQYSPQPLPPPPAYYPPSNVSPYPPMYQGYSPSPLY